VEDLVCRLGAEDSTGGAVGGELAWDRSFREDIQQVLLTMIQTTKDHEVSSSPCHFQTADSVRSRDERQESATLLAAVVGPKYLTSPCIPLRQLATATNHVQTGKG
jgi:hypothetical protein